MLIELDMGKYCLIVNLCFISQNFGVNYINQRICIKMTHLWFPFEVNYFF